MTQLMLMFFEDLHAAHDLHIIQGEPVTQLHTSVIEKTVKMNNNRIRGAIKKKMSQKVEKVHNFLDPPPLP